MTSAVRQLTEALIRLPSVTPEDGGCQALIAQRLAPLGFACETIAGGGVTNLWAIRSAGRPGPLVVFAGHTDVVPTGPLEQWNSDPFVPAERDGRLYGRGAADMKTSIAAFVVAVEELLAQAPATGGSIALLLTSDEEGPAVDGTVKVVERLRERGVRLDYCIVGEPTSVDRLGDTIKNGRRGSMSGRLKVRGLQGHIASPEQVRNPIHLVAPALAELAATRWDDGNEFFPPTSWQVSNIHGGTGATNIVPGSVEIDFNFRFSSEQTDASLRERFEAILRRHGLEFTIEWSLSGRPFITGRAELVTAVAKAIRSHTGIETELSTTGGTSDGRFIADICPQIVEFGPVNASIHKLDEHVRVADLEALPRIYLDILRELLA